METVEIVIKIPKDTFDAIGILQAFVDDKHQIDGYQMKGNSTIGTMIKAIANGTVLPKEHGRLIDAKEVYKKFYCRCLAGVASEILNETSTIIEADKEVDL